MKTIAMAATLTAAVFCGSMTAFADFGGTVTADALNIRSAPNTDSVILGQLPHGTNITISGKTDNWSIINYNGAAAYICADYINTNTAVQTAAPASQPSAKIPSAAVSAAMPQDGLKPENTVSVPADVPSYAGSDIAGEILIELAKQYVGTPYVYGGMSPSGFDCSGFVKYCYTLMNTEINRIACDQAKNGVEVSREEMKPGDILCFESAIGSGYIGHTGIYAGNGYFIHSPRAGYSVEVIPLTTGTFSERLVNIRRIFN